VQDAAAAFLRAVEASSEAAAGRVFNVGGEDLNFTVGEIAEKVVQQIPGTVVEYFDRIEDRRSYRVAFDRIRNELGFVPTWTVDDAIREVRATLQTGVVRDYGDDVYHNVKLLQRYTQKRVPV
jgi:nucleoside-diphosphate-sugar epimerase